MRTGVYPGTFDPITLGHMDIIRRAAHLVDRLVIGVTTNPSKSPMFTVAERLATVEREMAGIRDGAEIRVVTFDSLLMDFEGASMIIRGLRAVADFEYEFQMAGMNQQLNDEIETVFLMAGVSLQPIASKLVKEIARFGGDISRFVTPAYFATLRIPIKRGRDIEEVDARDRQPVAVVSESFVKRYWPDQDAASVIGRHITFAFSDRVVVGVAGDVLMRGLEREPEPQVYLSSKQVADGAIAFYSPKALAIRMTIPPAHLAPAIRDVIRRADPKVPISELQMATEMVDLETASRSVQVRVLSAFAVVAFVLAAIGIHGLLSFAVSQRVQEIGVRLALGAQSSDILSLIVWRGVLLAFAGIVPGVLIAYAAGRSMEALLAGVRPTDGVTLAAAIALSFLMTVLGTLAPTVRALRVDPMTALRAE